MRANQLRASEVKDREVERAHGSGGLLVRLSLLPLFVNVFISLVQLPFSLARVAIAFVHRRVF